MSGHPAGHPGGGHPGGGGGHLGGAGGQGGGGHPGGGVSLVKPDLVGDEFPGYVYREAPRNVYWETTIACDLTCVHCRANAIHERDPLELDIDEAAEMMRDIKEMGSMLILTGGDPMKRTDIFDLVARAVEIGVPTSITPSTTPTLTREGVERFKQLGIAAMGISIDGPTAELHDAFRGVEGTFGHSMNALAWAREFYIPVQVNTTVTAETLPTMPAVYELLRDTASPPVRRWALFLLVPVGRGAELGVPTADEVEELFGWVYETSKEAPFHMSTVEAPHYRRLWVQRRIAEGISDEELSQAAKRMGLGVRDGNGVIFVSHHGDVFPAGFLPYPRLGNVREGKLSEIYRDSPALAELRDMDALEGKCGECEFRWACGGSRARAWAMSGNSMGSDELCAYQPAAAVAS